MIVKIDKLDDFGRGITYINNKICFVNGALALEKVEIDIVNEKKKYIEANTIKIIDENNKLREKVKCPYYDRCGGCNFLHLKYDEENNYKKERVKNKLLKFSNIDRDLDIIYDKDLDYRNKLILHVIDNKIGFYEKNSNDLVEIDNCLLASSKINDIIYKIREFDNSKLETITIRVSNDQKYSSISLIGDDYDRRYLDICNVLVFNNNVISKDKYIITNIDDVKYRLSHKSFFQINRYLTNKMYSYIRDYVLKNDIKSILDLYCGVGSIGIYVCNNTDIKLYGIDNNESNIEDAKENSIMNNVDSKYLVGDASSFLDIKDIDLIIVDPARYGLNKNTINNLIKYKSKYLIYVSCNDSTMCRDLAILKDYYNIIDIKVFNNFPRTYHCESIAVLERK